MTNLRDSDLKEYFTALASPAAAAEIEMEVERLGLPLPARGEYLQTREGGALLYLEEEGCAVRITHDKKHPYNPHDFMLRPLGALKAAHFRIHVNPAVVCPIDTDEIESLVALLADDKLGFRDCFAENAGYLPVKTPEFPNGIPVVIDEPSVKALTDDIAAIFARPLDEKQRAAQRAARNIQDDLFAPARRAFRQALDTCGPDGKPAMRDFWDICRDMKKRGLFTDSWNHTSYERILKKNPKEISAAYSVTLARAGFH